MKGQVRVEEEMNNEFMAAAELTGVDPEGHQWKLAIIGHNMKHPSGQQPSIK